MTDESPTPGTPQQQENEEQTAPQPQEQPTGDEDHAAMRERLRQVNAQTEARGRLQGGGQ